MSKYDAPMIRDFLAHLLVELRASHLESKFTGPPPKGVVKHLAEERHRYAEKYGTVPLPITMAEKGSEAEALLAAAKKRDRKELEELVRCYEQLEPLFVLALLCIESGEKVTCCKVPLSVLADENVSWAQRAIERREEREEGA